MAGATKTTADSALKEDYQPLVREQLNNAIALLTYVEKNTKDTDGRRAVLSLHVSRNEGIGARAEGGTLPTAGSQGYAEERVSLKYNYGRGAISGPLMRAADADKGSFERAMEAETKRIVNDLKVDVNRQIWGTADGIIAGTAGTSTSVVVNLLSTVSDVQFRQLHPGMAVDIGTVASPTADTSNNVIVSTGGSSGAYTITLTTATNTTSSTDYIFRTGNGGSTTSQKEITGMQAIVASSGTLFNINPSTNAVWASYVSSNSGTNRALSENLMETVYDNVLINSGQEPNLIVTHHGVRRSYVSLLQSQKRFVNTVNLTGGYGSGLEFVAGGNVIPVTVDRDCPANQMFFINTSHLTEYMASDWEFMQEDGAVLHWLGTVDQYDFTLFKYAELATDQRNAHGLLKDITHS